MAQVTTVPDFVYFNHAAHVNSGISCVECHGQINQMEVVYQAKPMNMAWCLQCHRDPTDKIRPRNQVTHLDWKPSADDPSTVAAFESLPLAELHERLSKLQPPSDIDLKNVQLPKGELAKQYVVTVDSERICRRSQTRTRRNSQGPIPREPQYGLHYMPPLIPGKGKTVGRASMSWRTSRSSGSSSSASSRRRPPSSRAAAKGGAIS